MGGTIVAPQRQDALFRQLFLVRSSSIRHLRQLGRLTGVTWCHPIEARNGGPSTKRATELAPSGPPHIQNLIRSDDANVLCFLALAAGSDVEFDSLTFVEGLVALALDVGEVDEHIVATLT